MVHLWQFHFRKPGRRGYHNREWADKMLEVGLVPSDTGLPGARVTGDRMSHYVMESGPFDPVFHSLSLSLWFDRQQADSPHVTRTSGRAKFRCRVCPLNAWAKQSALLYWGACMRPLERVIPGERRLPV